MAVFDDVFGELQGVLDSYVHQTVQSAVAYVDGPIAIMATCVIIAMGLMLLFGMASRGAGAPRGEAAWNPKHAIPFVSTGSQDGDGWGFPGRRRCGKL
jgi:hypothetical protein